MYGVKSYFPIELIWIDPDMQASREGSGSTLRARECDEIRMSNSVGTGRQPGDETSSSSPKVPVGAS